ncbi:LysR substrate-binding domain-containing protein [Pelagibacterium lacus]|uniref:LysR family transcriptional regulator n=1 Tax=Pelagibacterium lacus TaxID=2282655 RepID=A0A369W0G2_9HYPH|nr:LysR substrate-binding domain-containing protein [Pelagibacterium lacus]RDE07863.1 LysR family transcriptional regulator [Pelagibacterium lacus]
MELRHLRYFVAVAEEEHITRAARRLGIQQPPLSQQIQALEQELGVSLFTRSPRSIKLNAAGKLFLIEARKVLAMAADAVQRVRDFDLGKEGTLRIGMTSSSSIHDRTLEIIRRYRVANPLVTMKVQEGANHDLLLALEQEALDVVFVRSTIERHPALTSITIDMEDVRVALPLGHRLADAEAVRLVDLADENFVRFRQPNASGIWDQLEAACARSGFAPKVTDETPRILSAIHMVAGGFGVTVLPNALTSFRNTAVSFVPLSPEDSFRVPLTMAFRQYADAQAARRFIAMAKAVVEGHPIARPGPEPRPAGRKPA